MFIQLQSISLLQYRSGDHRKDGSSSHTAYGNRHSRQTTIPLLRRLKGLLTILSKASHHKTFMEICLNKGEAPRAMVPQIKPHIYHTNPTTERLWRQTLQQALLSLVSILINHHASIVRETTTSLRELEQEIRTKLEGHPSRL